jgi:hypothetical protein
MCQRLAELREAMTAYSTPFDAELLSCADAAVVVREAAAIEHIAATVKALAAVRAAAAGLHKDGGHRNAEEHLARTTGSTITDAREALLLGRRLGEQPAVADAARAGRLSPTQAAAITEAVAADPTAGADLLAEAAGGGSVTDLKDHCARIKAAHSDLESHHDAFRRRRRLRGWSEHSEFRLAGNGTVEAGAQIMAALEPIANQKFEQARQTGRHEHPDAYRFDALLELCTQATSTNHPDHPDAHNAPAQDSPAQDSPASDRPDLAGTTSATAATGALDRSELPTGDDRAQPHRPDPAGTDGDYHPNSAPVGDTRSTAGKRRARKPRRGAPTKIIIRVDLTTLIRGVPQVGETCDLIGYGPIPVSVVHQLLATGDTFVTAILTRAKHIAGVVHLGRKPTAYQQTALEWLYPTCAAQGCPTTAAHLQTDHRIDWAQTHTTIYDWLDRLCAHHHNLKTRNNWALIEGSGKRPFVPPTDPRHPNYRRQEAPA